MKRYNGLANAEDDDQLFHFYVVKIVLTNKHNTKVAPGGARDVGNKSVKMVVFSVAVKIQL
ncbi:hypothetical protein ACTJIJ_12315 [Niabella sp. 22666]|uniref:hypothetical protein n=1 Tax=Niabella sp. 22666 TaxID=3453954 RepID=UPI003F86949C